MSLMSLENPQHLAAKIEWFAGHSKSSVFRPITKWVEEEIVLPNGPFEGNRYRHDRHPASRLLFEAIDSGKWNRFAVTGPTQNGKTLMGYVAPVLYHLFELRETVIIGLPDMGMANDKWQQDFLPVINSSRFRDLLPERGEGSRGGEVKRAITFKDGQTLRFMSGGGRDKKRAGYTARVAAITEVDGMDEAGDTSREADKIEQIEARTRAFGRTGKRIYLECTVSIESGRIWQELTRGTDSKIVRPCPHCGVYVTPEREHLVGWERAESEEQAAKLAHWMCPACSEPWTEEEKHEAAKKVKLLHRGQEITNDGVIHGEPAATQTLGFRWSAIDNPFVTAGDLGAEEWMARRNRDRENSERKMRQFVWCLPYEPPEIAITPLDPQEVQGKLSGLKRGEVPSDCIGIAIGVDTGKRELNWTACAALSDGSGRIIDYGEKPVECDRLGVHRGLVEALSGLFEFFENGWNGIRPVQVWIDSGYHEHTDAVYSACEAMNRGLEPGRERYRPSKGYGEGQRNIGRYLNPTGHQRDVIYIGRELHIAKVRRGRLLLPGVQLVHVNADNWKSELHQKLKIPAGEAGSICLFDVQESDGHAEFAQQLTAERQVDTPKGITWERISRKNHKLDSTYLATAACWFIGATKDGKKKPKSLAEITASRPTPQQLMNQNGNLRSAPRNT